MNYILIGILVSIGWHVVKLVYEAVEELIFARLHKADWYLIAAGKKPKEIKDKPGEAKTVRNQIGFQ